MKLSNFQFEQLSTSELQGVTGGQMELAFEGTTSTRSRRTSCTGSDHDTGRNDTD
jgi:bacteriocin-like protein